VREQAALGRTGGARGVDGDRQVVGAHTLHTLLELLGVPAATALAQVVERHRFPDVPRRLEHDDVLEIGQAVGDLADLLELLDILDEHSLGLGVLEHVVALLERVGLVHRHRDRSRAEDGQVGEGPIGTGVAEDGDLVAVLDAEVDQPASDLADRLAQLGVGDLRPLACVLVGIAGLVAQRGVVGVLSGGQARQVGHRLRARALLGRADRVHLSLSES